MISKVQKTRIRYHLFKRENVERVRVTRDGRVDAYGRMPNSTTIGWWFAGWAQDVLAEADTEAAS